MLGESEQNREVTVTIHCDYRLLTCELEDAVQVEVTIGADFSEKTDLVSLFSRGARPVVQEFFAQTNPVLKRPRSLEDVFQVSKSARTFTNSKDTSHSKPGDKTASNSVTSDNATKASLATILLMS